MIRKIVRSQESDVVALPADVFEQFGLSEGASIDLALSDDGRRVVVTPVQRDSRAITPEFASRVDAFIEQYRPALEALAQR